MRTICFAFALLSLSGCLPVSTYYAEGVSAAQLMRDDTRCDVQALREAPVANQTRQGAPRFVPHRVCDAAGQCYNRGGYWVPGDIYTVDVNADLRKRVKALCMADRGYRPVELPACRQGVAQAAPPALRPSCPVSMPTAVPSAQRVACGS
ncbi:hypothetical protein ACERZ8_14515 [Tateyamaria armeniaca]|uniref:Lipoprotein n=1 Tax=Tateyamaria armeniaca TaxID=2518930 RepID=A0ABW8UVC1_9RHOB